MPSQLPKGNPSIPSNFRKPVRICLTIPHHLRQSLLSRADEEGRSLSNLCAFLLESAMDRANFKPF